MKRNKFSLSHYKLLSCDMGELIPIGLTEVLPGDTIQQATSALVRCAPLMAPVMHPVHVRIHHWYVPFRIIWDDFEDFITGGKDGNATPAFPTCNLDKNSLHTGTLSDYLGVPVTTSTANDRVLNVSVLPFRAYNLIYNEWYRDQDLVPEVAISTASGHDTTTAVSVVPVAWEKDYFTTTRPWSQKGDEVYLPLGTSAPVIGDGTQNISDGSIGKNRVIFNSVNATGSAGVFKSQLASTQSTINNAFWLQNATGSTNEPMDISFNEHIPIGAYADLTQASAVNVNQLREAFALQRYKEARARYGSRYTEYLRYLGIRSSDARLQRPEYLGGGRQTIQFSEILQTANDSASSHDVGSLYGHGIGALRSNRYRRFIEEHGYILTTISILPKTIYMQGLPRTWSRRTKEDFFQKELQHIGQQEIMNSEIYADGTDADKGLFGYQDRYDEYRRSESSVSGEFRDTLNYWHYARDFANRPSLNADFVKAKPTKRTVASSSTDCMYIMANHSIQARRMLSKIGSSSVF